MKIQEALSATTEKGIKRMLIRDIKIKYNVNNGRAIQSLYKCSIEVLRSLLVFGDHEIILKPYLKNNK